MEKDFDASASADRATAAEPEASALRDGIPSADDPVVGSASMTDGSRRLVRKSEADAIWASIEAEKAERQRLMPELCDALRMLGRVSQRLQDLGWREAIYCPKDGSVFEVIEFGSTGIHDCHYDGKWPDGHWWVHGGGDLWPSHPVLFREKHS